MILLALIFFPLFIVVAVVALAGQQKPWHKWEQ